MEANKPNNTFVFVVIFIALLGVIFSMVLVNKKYSKNKPPQNLPTSESNVREMLPGNTSLYFSPSSQNVSPGQVITVKAYMNTSDSLVNGIELKTVYDPNVFEVNKLIKEPTMTGLSQEIRNEIDNTAGVFRYSAFGLDKTAFLNGSSLFLFTLEVKVKETAKPGVYSFDFDPSTVISASGAGQNVFEKSIPQKITVSP